MASWPEVVQALKMLPQVRPSNSEELLWVDISFENEGRTQKLAVSYDVLEPSMEFVQIRSAFALLNDIDAANVMREYGQLLAGSIGFTPIGSEHGNDNGIVSLVSNIPLACLDLREPWNFQLYLHIFARCADQIESRLSPEPLIDRF